MVGMSDIYPEIMHLDQLNVAKQIWTKGPLRLMSAHMRSVSADFYKGMGFKLDCKLKSDGRSGTAWFKASQWNEACRGSQKVPGGLAAWMPSLLFFIGEDFLDKQSSLKPLRAAADASAEDVLRARYGAKGKEILNQARLYDCYVRWHNTNYINTPDEAGKATAALANALAAHDLVVAFKSAAQETGKTWIFHIILFILPRMIRLHGKPWPFSTAKLESRGKSMKDIVVHQSSGKPTSKVSETIFVSRPARGGDASKKAKSGINKTVFKRAGNSGNQMRTVLAKATLREDLALCSKGKPMHRKAEQLMTLGKATITTTVKVENDRDARWVGKVPDGVPFTVEGLLVAMVQGKCKPLYSIVGKHNANPLHPVEGIDAS